MSSTHGYATRLRAQCDTAISPGPQPILIPWPRAALLSSILLVIWGELFLKLTTDWTTNQQYQFGFFVPVLMLVLLIFRWSGRPPITVLSPVRIEGYISLALLILLLPLQVIQVANPDWRPLNWVHASIVSALTLLLAGQMGGRAWIRHFAPPLALIFFALPWPLAAEQGVIQLLTRWVTTAATELLNWCQISAVQRGNVIETTSGSVGVSEACSGIRSLAGTLMAAAFLGEFFRLTARSRLMLLFGGIATAYILNVIRAFALSWIHARLGAESLQRWHDTAGFLVFGVSFALLWSGAAFLAKDNSFATHQEKQCSWRNDLRQSSTRLPMIALGSVVSYLVAVGIITEMWYRAHESGRVSTSSWNLEWPRTLQNFRLMQIPAETTSILRYSEGSSGLLNEPGLPAWSVYFLRWAPGRTSAQLAVMHRPEICLPATGLHHLGKAAPLQIALPNSRLLFTGSIFEKDAQRIYVYRCLWEEMPLTSGSYERTFDMSIRGRLQAAWYGRRNLGQRLLQISILGAKDEHSARTDLLKRLPTFISRAKT